MSGIIRAFIAVDLPDILLEFFKGIQTRLKNHGLELAYTRSENVHITLKFMGNINKDLIPEISRMMEKSVIGSEPMLLSVKGIGAFPSVKRPNVVWLGINGDIIPLEKLYHNLDHHLRLIGFKKEKRRFKSHLTLGRVKRRIDSKKLIDAIKSFGMLESETSIIKTISLVKSDLKPSGPIYTKLNTLDL